MTVQSIFTTAEKLGSGIKHLKLTDLNEDWNTKLSFIGIYSKNTLNYFISDIAFCLYDITTVPIYDTLGESAINFMFE